MSKSKQVFRYTVSVDSMLGTVEALQQFRAEHGLNSGATELLVKFEKELIGIGYGSSKPAYVISGKRKESAISLDSLGANEGFSSEGKYNNSAEMDDATNAQLNWLIMRPEISTADAPHINEFKPGGRYYESTGETSNAADYRGIERNGNGGRYEGINSDEFIGDSRCTDSTDYKDGIGGNSTGNNSSGRNSGNDSGSIDSLLDLNDLDAQLADELFKSL